MVPGKGIYLLNMDTKGKPKRASVSHASSVNVFSSGLRRDIRMPCRPVFWLERNGRASCGEGLAKGSPSCTHLACTSGTTIVKGPYILHDSTQHPDFQFGCNPMPTDSTHIFGEVPNNNLELLRPHAAAITDDRFI
jgi:hypothetical protein